MLTGKHRVATANKLNEVLFGLHLNAKNAELRYRFARFLKRYLMKQ
jgi:hypothetical protein